jgi:hypothetical protein
MMWFSAKLVSQSRAALLAWQATNPFQSQIAWRYLVKSVSVQSVLALLILTFISCGAVSQAQTPAAAAPGDAAPDVHLVALIQTVFRFESNLLTLADAMPADKFNFAPGKDTFKSGSPAEFATVRTFAQQLTHVCAEPYRQFAPFGVKPDTDVDLKSFDSLKTKDDIMKALKDSIGYQNKVIGSITQGNAFTPAGPRNATRVAALIATLSDDGDHYGQMVEYLRMNGIIPPATANQMRRMSQPPPQK